MLSTNRQANGILINILICQLLISQLRMSGSSRMDYQALYICNIGQQGENLQVINKLVSFLLAAFYVKGKDRSAAIREILLIESMVWMLWQRWMIYLFY